MEFGDSIVADQVAGLMLERRGGELERGSVRLIGEVRGSICNALGGDLRVDHEARDCELPLVFRLEPGHGIPRGR